jgi:cytidylate kinase
VSPPRARPIVAIDGPAGAGKSTVARKLSDALGYILVDTGATYRAVALAAKRAGLQFDDGPKVTALAEGLVRSGAIVFDRDERGVRTRLSGEDVSEAIRTPDIAMGASTVSAHGGVRAALLDLQRQAGKNGGVVLEGRDIGTVVFPDAEAKFFLTARPEIRAARRHEELIAKAGAAAVATFEETLADVRQRDAQDSNRAVAPLRQAEGAMLIDSSDLTIDETVAVMSDFVARITSGKR